MFLMNSAKDLFPHYDPAAGRPLRVGVLVMDQTNMLALASAVDPMRAANRRAGATLFDWQFLTASGEAAGVTAGFALGGAPLAQAGRLDLLILAGSFRIEAQATPALLSQLRRRARAGTAIIGVDGGSWVLAESGLLDGLAATTHWEDLDRFEARFPRVHTLRDRFHIDGRLITTGGASPCLDLMLHLIERLHGGDLARRVASAFIYEPLLAGDAPQRLVPTAAIARRHPLVARAIALMETRLDNPEPVEDIAAALGISRRQLEQRFQKAIGQSPHGYALGLRLAEARRLATDGDQKVQDIALATGFGSHAAFARAFRARFGTSVRDLRRARNSAEGQRPLAR